MTARIRIAIAACAMIVAAQANAADNSGFYVGVSGGLARTTVDETDFKEEDIAYKAFGGYSISDLIAFEGAYFNGGNPSIEEPGGFAEVAVSGINASVLLRARTGSSFALYAKVGYAMYDVKQTAQVSGAAVEANESDGGLSYGLGVTYTIARKYLVRAEFEGVDTKFGSGTTQLGAFDGSFYMVTIGAGYRF